MRMRSGGALIFFNHRPPSPTTLKSGPAAIAGHSSVLTSQRYVHPTPEAIENAMGRLEAYNATKTAGLVTERVQ